MFDIDINERGLCPKCYKEDQFKKQTEEKLNIQKKETIDSCKNCGEQMKKLYLNFEGLCYKCNKNKINNKNLPNKLERENDQENKKVEIIDDVYKETKILNKNPIRKTYWHWFGYIWIVLINIFTIIVVLNIYDSIKTPFEKIVISLLILIYVFLQTFSMTQGKANAEKIFFMYDEFRKIRTLLKEDQDEYEQEEINYAKDKVKKMTVKIYINAVFLTIIYFIAILNIVFIN